jgi:hypothetical protein
MIPAIVLFLAAWAILAYTLPKPARCIALAAAALATIWLICNSEGVLTWY